MKKKWTLLLAFIIGFASAMILMGIWIYLGYCNAYRTGADQYTISLLGISIYQLTRTETGYSASAIGPNMGIICGICLAVSFTVERIIHKLRRH